ncbi:hypothetical protein F4677DRAFT_20632 [Hypoxylon crocopeplum]|nr:hypothetical protein F4677DRAFT_20632 [Hypoxylon crocopeplum]
MYVDKWFYAIARGRWLAALAFPFNVLQPPPSPSIPPRDLSLRSPFDVSAASSDGRIMSDRGCRFHVPAQTSSHCISYVVQQPRALQKYLPYSTVPPRLVRFSGVWLIVVTFGFTKKPRIHAGQWTRWRQTKLTQVLAICNLSFYYTKSGRNFVSG